MKLKQQIDQDLKAAMLAGDKSLVMTLRGLKSVILDAEIASGSRETGLSDDAIIGLLGKETKKRQDSADLYVQGGNTERQAAELKEKKVIQKYLPSRLGNDELNALIDKVITKVGNSPQNMGRIIGQVKQKSHGAAEGSLIARLVKEKLQ